MAACAASKIAQQAAITGSRVSMVVLRTTPQRRPAMAKVEHTSDARVLVGIDISKHRHEVLIAVQAKTANLAGRPHHVWTRGLRTFSKPPTDI